MKSIAFICSGAEDGLDSLIPDRNAMQTSLVILNKWHFPFENKQLTTFKDFIAEIEKYKDKDVEEFLFYYTGHGKRDGIITQKLFLDLADEPSRNIEDFIRIIYQTLKPKHMALILDACNSGTAISTLEYPNCNFEIITSSTEIQFSSTVGDHSDLSYFTEKFIEAITSGCMDKHEINFDMIKQYINTLENKQICLSLAKGKDKNIIMGYNQKIRDLTHLFQDKYFYNIDNFKKDILAYLKTHTLVFSEILELNNFQDIFKILLTNNDCLYCLLKQINNRHEYLDELDTVNDCEILKNDIYKSRTIKSIVLVITTDTGDDISSCAIEGYLECIDGTYFNAKTLIGMNFKTDDYKEKLSNYLSELLETIHNSEDILELKLILSDALFEINFYDLDIEERSPLPISRNIIEKFNITTKLFLRFENYNKKVFFEKWEKNINKCKQLESQRVTTHLCSIENKEDIASMDKIFLAGDTSTGNCIDYIALISRYSLKAQKNLYRIISGGLPIVLYPQYNEEENLEIAWLETLVKDIKVTTFNHITGQKNIHFLYDTYDEAKSLQTAIKNNQIKDYK